MATDTWALILILRALAFDFPNGFHDAATSVSTVAPTRGLSPQKAVIVNDTGQVRVQPGRVLLAVSGRQRGFKGLADATTTQVAIGETEMTGAAITLVP